MYKYAARCYDRPAFLKKHRMFTVLLSTNSKVLEQGFIAVFGGNPEMQIRTVDGQLENITQAQREHAPDVLLFDFAASEHFPALAELRRRMPESRTVLWVDGISIEAGYQAMKLGVRGIIKKSEEIERAQMALRQVAEGQLCFEQSLISDFLEARTVGLTPRESQLVPLVAKGLKNREIAAALDLCESTVRIYLSALFRKLGVRDRQELAIYAMKNLPSGRAAGPVLQSMLMGKATSPHASVD
jgi:two-component system, NarL family, nitrate/nitrite response regulator NarL